MDALNQSLQTASVARTRTLSLLTALTVMIVPASIAWVSLLLTQGHPLPMQQPGAWTMLLFTVSLLSASLMGLVRSLDQLINFVVARRRLLQLLQNAREAKPVRTGKHILARGKPLSVTVNTLADPSLQFDAPLHAPAGSSVAVIGASGIGKSQLLQCLQLANNDSSEIFIDSLKLDEITPASLRKRVQRVTPEFALMRGSLLRNLRYAAQIKHRALQRICKLCLLDVEDMAAARQQRINQAGSGLPSSLAARIRLARALASRPGVLLVDDAAFLYDPIAQQALLSVQAEKRITLLISAPDQHSVAWLRPDTVWHLKKREVANQKIHQQPEK